MSQNNQMKADYGKIGGQFIPIVSPFLRFAGDVFRSKEEKEAIAKRICRRYEMEYT